MIRESVKPYLLPLNNEVDVPVMLITGVVCLVNRC
jgi:hypothetical protein